VLSLMYKSLALTLDQDLPLEQVCLHYMNVMAVKSWKIKVNPWDVIG